MRQFATPVLPKAMRRLASANKAQPSRNERDCGEHRMAMTVACAREIYFALNGFSTVAYEARWVRLKLGPFPFAFPNIRSNRRAIPYHDLNHVVTGYGTTLRGEGELAAWEIAATFGARGRVYWAAWVLNSIAIMLGLAVAPRRVYSAFVRGRTCRSLYGMNLDAVLALEVDDVRRQLGLCTAAPPSRGRRFA